MKLKKITIVGFKYRSKKIELEFSDEKSTIIYGDNGCGKTTFLQILHAVFSQDESVLIDNKVKEIEIIFEEQEKPYVLTISEITDEIKQPEIKQQYDWRDFENYKFGNMFTLLLGVDRGINVTRGIPASIIFDFFRFTSQGNKFYSELGMPSSRRLSDQLAEYLSYHSNRRSKFEIRNIFNNQHVYLKGNNIDINVIEETIVQRYLQVTYDASKKIQSALFETFSQVINEKTDASSSEQDLEYVKKELEPNYLLISKSLASTPNSENNDVLISIKDKSLDELLTECKNRKHICLLMKNIIKNIMPERELLNSVLLLQDKFNSHLIDGKKMNIAEDGISIKLKNGKHRLNELSSGEAQFLTLLTCSIIDSSKRNIIMIDEPELSLNISWQNELIDLIEECAPDTQVILATHSPSVVNEHVKCIRELL